MKKYIIDGKEITKIERIEHLKKLSSEIREQIIKKNNNLFSDEIDDLLEFLRIDLKSLIKEGE